MFEEFLKRAIANAALIANEKKEKEVNSLMLEIETFHMTEAIDNALENNDKEMFVALMKLKTPDCNRTLSKKITHSI